MSRVLIAEMSRSLAEGPARSALRIARALPAERYEVSLVVPPGLAEAYRREKLWDGTLHSVGMPRPRMTPDPTWWAGFAPAAARARKGLKRLLEAERPDVLLINSVINIHAARAAAGLGIPVLWYVREILPDRGADNLFLRWAAERCHSFVAVSRAVADRLARGGVPGDKIRVIHNSVPAVRVAEETLRGLRRAYDIPEGAPVVSIVSSIDHRKGHHILLDAVRTLAGDFPGLIVVVAGEALESAAYEKALRERIRALGLEDRYRFIGRQADPFPIYALGDVVVQPSVTPDPLPRTVIEAAATGRPVVGSDTGGIPEMIVPGRTGLLAPASDPAPLAAALKSLLGDRERARAMGAAAAAFAVEQFGEQAMGGKLDRLMQEAIKTKK